MTNHPVFQPDPIPAAAGVGLKPQHFVEVLERKPAIGWFEVHPENYMGEGGSPHAYLSEIRAHYPLSCHGVGLSLGGVGPLDADHLSRLQKFVRRYEPGLVSEHLAWSSHDGVFLNDLLPLPLTDEALELMVEHVDQMQEALGRQVLVENPSTYLTFDGETMDEAAFLIALARRTGCQLLFDVNNVYVSAQNHGFDATVYIDAVPGSLIGEIHLAGHAVEMVDGVELRIDDHGSEVVSDVWRLYERLVARIGSKPSLIEWDTNIPAWSALFAEAQKADLLMKQNDLILGHRHGHERGQHD